MGYERRWRTFLGCALAISLAINFGLSVRVAALRASVQSAPAGRALVGYSIPELRGVTLDGESVVVRAGDAERTLVYVFSARCQWCERNREAIAALTRSLPESIRVIGVAFDDRDIDTLTEGSYPFPVVTGVDPEQARSFPAAGTPTTLVVARDGRIEQAWSGAYTGSVHEDVERYFHVELPTIATS